MAATAPLLPAAIRADALTLWDYHHLHHELRVCDVGIGLGGHDPGVAAVAAGLYRQGLFGIVVFSGANAPTTADRFPRGEAVHFRDAAVRLGVPLQAVRVEPRATNTAENLAFSRDLLRDEGVGLESVLLITRPSQQRRAYATCRKVWPEVTVLCASTGISLDGYIDSIGDIELVVSTLVGDTQRITEYAQRGFAIPQDLPIEVQAANERLVRAGYTARLAR